jgi:hypothetical protein
MYDSLGEQYWAMDSTTKAYFRGYIREEDEKIFLMDVNLAELMQYDFGQPDYTDVHLVAANSTCWSQDMPQIMTHDTVCIGPTGRKRWTISPSQYPWHFISLKV